MTQKIKNTFDLADVVAVDVSGYLWTDVHANTFHSVYVSVLLKAGGYYELGENSFSYGYDNEYETTALKILGEALTGFNPTESALYRVADELGFKVNSHKTVVKRKKDM